MLALGRKTVTNLDTVLKSRDIILLTKVCLVTAMVFPVVMYWCDSWTVKKVEHQKINTFKLWCWRRLLRVPWIARSSNPVNPKGDQPWIFTERTDTEAAILWPLDAKSQLIGKDPDAGRYWRQKEKRVTEDEMVRWHHWANGHEFEQTPKTVKNRRVWCAVVQGVTESWTWVNDWTTAMRSKESISKTNKWNYIQLSLLPVKETVNKMKRQPMEWEKTFACHIYD